MSEAPFILQLYLLGFSLFLGYFFLVPVIKRVKPQDTAIRLSRREAKLLSKQS